MKIAIVSTIWEKVPPEKYGGTELVVYNLAEGLVKNGHKVTVFASGNSKTSARLVSVVPKTLREMGIGWNEFLYPLLNLTQALDMEKEFDIIHVQFNTRVDYFVLPFARYLKTPIVSTMHFEMPTTPDKANRKIFLEKYREHPLVTISNAQRKIPNLNYVATVYNGIEVDKFDFNDQPEDYLFWMGRFSESKGPREAIQVAKKTGQKLILAGKIDEMNPEYMEYYHQEVEPHFDNKQIIYFGEANHEQKNKLLRNAKALLNLIQWDEPFGLVPVESMATGTPVIATKRGSMPELIKDGETGFLVKDVDGAIETLKKIDQIDRKVCRQHVMENFSVSKMVADYEKVYLEIINNFPREKRS